MPDPSTSSAPHSGRLRRAALGCALALGLPTDLLWAMMPRHPEDGFERLPGLLERPKDVERHGRMTARYFERSGWGPNGGDSFAVLEVDGDRVEIPGGHLGVIGFGPWTGSGDVGEAAYVHLYHRDPTKRGYHAIQLVGDELRWTWLCDSKEGPLDYWEGTRLVMGCGVVYDAVTGRMKAEERLSPADEFWQ